jgi:hypothetical protein
METTTIEKIAAQQRYLVFDVESVGLHGEGFAVGWVIIDDGLEVESGCFAAPPNSAVGSAEGHEWVGKNLPAIEVTHTCPRLVRWAFWRLWQKEKERGSKLVADCAWPVEARFLASCVDDHPLERTWQGPYPLLDLAPVLVAAGHDPIARTERLANEKPEHHPKCDARQSSRVFLRTLRLLAGLTE